MWFQNRRTKHKRVQQEGDDAASTSSGPSSKKTSSNGDGGNISSCQSPHHSSHFSHANDNLDMSDDDANSDIDLEVSDDEEFCQDNDRRHCS